LRVAGFPAPNGWTHPVTTGKELPIRSIERGNFRPQHPAQHHVIAAIPETVIRDRVHVMACIVHISAVAAIFNKIGGCEAPAGEHRMLIVLAHGTAPCTPKIMEIGRASCRER